MKLPRYEAYKPCSVVWLEKIPVHWDFKRAKSLFKIIDQRSKSGKEELLTVSSTYGVVPRSGQNVTMFMAKSYIGHKLCWPNDLVINSLWAWARGLGFSKNHGIISTAYSVYRLRTYANSTKFLDYLFRSEVYHWEFLTRSKGIWISRLQLSDWSFMDMPVLLPSPLEQEAIVRYLDHATHKIDRAVRAKKKLIAALNEQKQAIIAHVVTRGLDPNVPMKESGVAWLREIPAHWDVKRGKTLFRKINRPVLPEYDVVTCFRDGEVTLRKNRRTTGFTEALKEIGYQGVCKGDLVIHAMDAFAGAVGVSDSDGKCSPVYAICSPIAEVFPKYYALIIREMARNQWIAALSKGIRERSTDFRFDMFGMQHLPVPPFAEQESIIRYIDQETAAIDKAIELSKKEIDLLQEYKTRLIADAVTGAVDVRELAKELPEIAEEIDDENILDETDDEVVEEMEE